MSRAPDFPASMAPQSDHQDDQDLHDFVTSNHERNFELEATLPTAETLDDIREYESQIAGMTYLEVEDVAAREPIYEEAVANFLAQVAETQGMEPSDEVIPEPDVPFEAMEYGQDIAEILDIIEGMDMEDNVELYEQLEERIDNNLNLIETQIPGHPEAVSVLRKFVRLGVYVHLLKGPGMGVLLEPRTVELIDSLRGEDH
jgi:hypothetical protein